MSSSVPPHPHPWGGGASLALPSRPPPCPDVGSQGGPTSNLVKKGERERERESPFPPSLSSCLLPPLFASLTFSPAFPLPRGSGRRAYRWMKFKAEHQKAERVGESPAATSCPGGWGLRAALPCLPPHIHSHHSLFTFHFQALPLQLAFHTRSSGLSLACPPPPLSDWRPSKGPLTSLI